MTLTDIMHFEFHMLSQTCVTRTAKHAKSDYLCITAIKTIIPHPILNSSMLLIQNK